MQDKLILKRLLELGLERLIEISGQTLEDFVAGQNVPEAPPKVPDGSLPKVDDTSFDDARAARIISKEDQLNAK